jgi:S1-C subfamily serine protease
MTGVDWIIVGIIVLLGFFGWAQGFLAGALSLAGFAVGALIGTRLGPLLLPDGSQSPYAPMFGLLGAIVAGAILASGLEGLGSRVRGALRVPGLATLDGVLGALLMACLALGLVWVIGAVALQTPGSRDLRRTIQRSAILKRLNEVLPSRKLLNALARFDPFPHITGPAITVPPPNSAIARDPDVRRASPSVVKIHGTACGLGVEGSGWVAGPGIVVTNAHVVAGEEDTEVLPGGNGPGLSARAVHFDSRTDIAVLRVTGLNAPALRLAPTVRPGTAGAILGYPLDGPFQVRPGRVGNTRVVLTQDAYGRGPVTRKIVELRGRIQSGNSGGPVVDGQGRVLATIFAATVSGPRGGYGVPDDVVRNALRNTRSAVSTGPCAR